jgi:hypothetical protein
VSEMRSEDDGEMVALHHFGAVTCVNCGNPFARKLDQLCLPCVASARAVEEALSPNLDYAALEGTILLKATGHALDGLARNMGMERFKGEPDDELRLRIWDRIVTVDRSRR